MPQPAAIAIEPAFIAAFNAALSDAKAEALAYLRAMVTGATLANMPAHRERRLAAGALLKQAFIADPSAGPAVPVPKERVGHESQSAAWSTEEQPPEPRASSDSEPTASAVGPDSGDANPRPSQAPPRHPAPHPPKPQTPDPNPEFPARAPPDDPSSRGSRRA